MCPESKSILGCMNRRIVGRWREVIVLFYFPFVRPYLPSFDILNTGMSLTD